MWLLGIALSIVLAVCAWQRARTRAEHRPVAMFVTCGLIADLVGRALVLLNARAYGASQGAPLSGLARVNYHASEALYLVWPLGLAALGFRVFLGRASARSPVDAVAGVYVGLVVGLAVSYPAVRPMRDQLYLVAEIAAVAAAMAAGVTWWKRPERPTLTDGSVLVFAALEVGAITGWRPATGWDWQRVMYLVAFAALIFWHLGDLWAGSRQQRRTA